MLLAGAVVLAGCGRQQGQGQTEDVLATRPPAANSSSGPGVTRTEVKRVSTEPPPLANVIQEQPGRNGIRVALNRVAVTGDVLTVQMRYQGDGCCEYIPIDRVSVIDDATAQQFGVLKHGQGRFFAAPVTSSGDQSRIDMDDRGPSIVWFEFPAPPPTGRTVSINIPDVGPFDGVPVAR